VAKGNGGESQNRLRGDCVSEGRALPWRSKIEKKNDGSQGKGREKDSPGLQARKGRGDSKRRKHVSKLTRPRAKKSNRGVQQRIEEEKLRERPGKGNLPPKTMVGGRRVSARRKGTPRGGEPGYY